MFSRLRVTVAVACLSFSCLEIYADPLPSPTGETLPNTALLKLEEPLDEAMVRGISLYAERELRRAKQERTASWLKHAIDSQQGRTDRIAARSRVKEIIGLPKQLAEHPVLSRSGNLPGSTNHTAPFAEFEHSVVATCQWDSSEGVTGRGLIAVPKKAPKGDQPITFVVLIPDADQTPESLFGLDASGPDIEQTGRILAEQGFIVLSPALLDRDFTWSAHPDVAKTNLPHREYIYRLSFELGLHPVGFEVAKVLTGIEAVKQEFNGHPIKTIVVGTGEGGLIALMAGAVADKEIDGLLVRGYFNERENVWQEPIYRNLYGQLKEFGDAELASLIAPRPLIIENSSVTPVEEIALPTGHRHVAAPGRIETPSAESVKREFNKAHQYYRQCGAESAIALLSPDSGSTEKSTDKSTENAGLSDGILLVLKATDPGISLKEVTTSLPKAIHKATEEFKANRMKSQVEELVRETQRVMHLSQNERNKLWKELRPTSVESYTRTTEKFRKLVHETFIGTMPEASVPMNPRSRKVYDDEGFTGYEVVLDVHPAGPVPSNEDWGIIAGGVLLIPKDLKQDEKRPVVVFQHGLEGTPEDCITTDEKDPKWKAYKGAASELANRGFVVYVPQNPYRGFHNFRVIQRKSNPLGRSLFTYIIEQHRQTLKWLASLSYVDPERIAFYGISYGGKTAMRVPTILVPQNGQPGYCLSICSADFNEWIRKNASASDRYSYVYTHEYEIYEWNMGHIANYAELAWLMIPRPFMVERGLDDGVAPDDWVSSEFARVLRHYMKLGIPAQTEIEIFDGPHAINGQGTYEFLHRHLNWAKPSLSQ